MASTSIVLQARLRGRWRLRLLSWFAGLLLPGIRLEYRLDNGPWRPFAAGEALVRTALRNTLCQHEQESDR